MTGLLYNNYYLTPQKPDKYFTKYTTCCDACTHRRISDSCGQSDRGPHTGSISCRCRTHGDSVLQNEGVPYSLKSLNRRVCCKIENINIYVIIWKKLPSTIVHISTYINKISTQQETLLKIGEKKCYHLFNQLEGT